MEDPLPIVPRPGIGAMKCRCGGWRRGVRCGSTTGGLSLCTSASMGGRTFRIAWLRQSLSVSGRCCWRPMSLRVTSKSTLPVATLPGGKAWTIGCCWDSPRWRRRSPRRNERSAPTAASERLTARAGKCAVVPNGGGSTIEPNSGASLRLPAVLVRRNDREVMTVWIHETAGYDGCGLLWCLRVRLQHEPCRGDIVAAKNVRAAMLHASVAKQFDMRRCSERRECGHLHVRLSHSIEPLLLGSAVERACGDREAHPRIELDTARGIRDADCRVVDPETQRVASSPMGGGLIVRKSQQLERMTLRIAEFESRDSACAGRKALRAVNRDRCPSADDGQALMGLLHVRHEDGKVLENQIGR